MSISLYLLWWDFTLPHSAISAILNLYTVFCISLATSQTLFISLPISKALLPLITESISRVCECLRGQGVGCFTDPGSDRWWQVKESVCISQQPARLFYRLSIWKWLPLHSASWANSPKAPKTSVPYKRTHIAAVLGKPPSCKVWGGRVKMRDCNWCGRYSLLLKMPLSKALNPIYSREAVQYSL